MTEQELYHKIKESAQRETVPASLDPEQIVKRLNHSQKIHPVSHFSVKSAVSAAAVLLLCTALYATAWRTGQFISDQNESVIENNMVNNPKENLPYAKGTSEDTEAVEEYVAEPKKDAGTLYKVAKSYQEVYDVVQAAYEGQSKYESSLDYNGNAWTEGIKERSAEDSVSNNVMAKAEQSAQKLPYSTTNLQMQDVDESDHIKTDGRYIYTVSGSKLKIVDTADEKIMSVGYIAPDLNASDSILEFYVDQKKLFLLVQSYDTALEETKYQADDESGMIMLEGCDKIRSLDTNASTILYTYDISDPAHPKLAETTEQDGYYYSSRKIGDIIYLFTQQGIKADDYNGFVPCIEGQKIPYGNIYISEEGRDGFLISSVNVNDAGKIMDKVMLVHNSVNIYVSRDAIYLYHCNYKSSEALTEIAKFSIQDGEINAVNAASVKGEINDTFAINAYQDTLRVLTTVYDGSGNTENHLYLLDDDLKLLGSLDGIARGEEIYAARYFGNTAYFITYKNTDPLFAVDLTDASHPVMLGELKITGFSEYLHFWGKDKLLGIGYETNPDSGERQGLKLVMFDISNPADLKVIDSMVLKGSTYSPALYQYKCALANPDQNLIGFVAEHSVGEMDYYASYDVYSFVDGHFVSRLSEKMQEFQNISYDLVRGVYIGDVFYVVSPLEIISYRISDGFERLEHLDLEEKD